METACDEAGIEYEDLDKILLVGGSTRMPLVKESIEDETGIAPSSEVHPDEAVAIGAAYHVLDVIKNNINEISSDRNNNPLITCFLTMLPKPKIIIDNFVKTSP
mgnify:CR=1 FL=1